MKTVLWAKTVKDTKMLNDCCIRIENYTCDKLTDYITEICYKLDLETPVILSKHIKYIERYNIVKFYKDDFVDNISFDYFLIEKSIEE